MRARAHKRACVRVRVCRHVPVSEQLRSRLAGREGGTTAGRTCFTGCVGGRMFSTSTFVITCTGMRLEAGLKQTNKVRPDPALLAG